MLRILTGVFVLVLLPGIQADIQPRRNLVVILIDDLRADVFGYAGHPFLKTPHTDALAADGVRFTRAFVNTSLCSPARATLLTGQYMHRHGVVDNSTRIPEGTPTYPQLLQQSGYQTAFIGKWHMGSSSDAPRPGFDHWVSFRGQGTYSPEGQTINVNGTQQPRKKYATDELTDYAVEWLQQRSTQQPFLLLLSHKGVHGLYDPAPRHRDLYRQQAFPEPVSFRRETALQGDKPLWVLDQRNSWHGVEFPYHGRSGQTLAEMYRHYCEMVLSIDDSVGQVRACLEASGVAANTTILFTSDGGHLWGEHGLIDKRCAYEASIRVPFLMASPGLAAKNSLCRAIVSSIDVAPTLLELAQVSVPATMDGVSLRPLLEQPDKPEEVAGELLYEYYWEPAFPQTPTNFALRTNRWKLIQYHGVWDHDELYDLQDDPEELQNLIHSEAHQSLVREMRQRLHEKLADTDGLQIPLGRKLNHGSGLRSAVGSERAEFPARILSESP